ncbi:MAG TPA: right-handed parallel beta-helix repeat-containing protein [Longimicrobium sp.]|nr:right-handed parallel beta-helix repeat-containing protein [Longimicrobium sp.]
MRWNALSLLGIAALGAACQDVPNPLGPPSSPALSTLPAACAGTAAGRVVNVATADALEAALAAAQPGDLIVLADGIYRRWGYNITASGTASAPITLCGSRSAVLRSTSLGNGGMIRLKANHWRLTGFSVDSAMFGIHVSGGSHNVLEGLSVRHTGYAGIKINDFSNNNVVRRGEIDDTGLGRAEWGEGIYIGTDRNAWPTPHVTPDVSDSNQVLETTFGPLVRAENVDVKEGTTGGTIAGNTFDGRGMIEALRNPRAPGDTLPRWVNSWVTAKGNGYVIRDNRGEYTPEYGIRVDSVVGAWGRDNRLENNWLDLRGAPGYGFFANVGTAGTVVGCGNTVVHAGRGFANVLCEGKPLPPACPQVSPADARWRVVRVGTAYQLDEALADARAGDVIVLGGWPIAGRFTAARSGTAASPIDLCGTRSAVLDGGSVAAGNGVTVTGSWWRLAGFTVRNSQNGVVVQGGRETVLRDLEIHTIGQTGVWITGGSRANTVERSSIHHAGTTGAERYGRAIMSGTWNGSWVDGVPDRSDSTRVLDNQLGPYVTAEHVLAREGTTGGLIAGNVMDGTGQVQSESWIDSWVEILGNGYTVRDNRGARALRDGFQVRVELAGWGNDNLLGGNTADVQAAGYGYRVYGAGNVLKCTNTAANASQGLSNVACTP